MSINIFVGMVSALDEAIGNITDKIKELGMYNDTLFAFTADVRNRN